MNVKLINVLGSVLIPVLLVLQADAAWFLIPLVMVVYSLWVLVMNKNRKIITEDVLKILMEDIYNQYRAIFDQTDKTQASVVLLVKLKEIRKPNTRLTHLTTVQFSMAKAILEKRISETYAFE